MLKSSDRGVLAQTHASLFTSRGFVRQELRGTGDLKNMFFRALDERPPLFVQTNENSNKGLRDIRDPTCSRQYDPLKTTLPTAVNRFA